MWLLSTTVILPSLLPRLVDPLWLKLDEPRDEHVEVAVTELEQRMAREMVAKKKAPIAIGSTMWNRPPSPNSSCEEGSESGSSGSEGSAPEEGLSEQEMQLQLHIESVHGNN